VNRREVLEAFAELRDGAPVITGPGSTSGLLWSLGHEPATIYNMELGYATAMCAGLAMATPDQRVFALEGDGSMVAGLATLTTVSRYKPANLVVIVLDNGIYATGVGAGPGITEETATTHGTSIAAVATSCGIPREQVRAVETPSAFADALAQAIAAPGPWIIVARIDASDASGSPKRIRPGVDVVESATLFKREMIERGFGAPPGT
jgi:thiamine pyrophosphate-dependent acetolactate synthase large subunit-like protein